MKQSNKAYAQAYLAATEGLAIEERFGPLLPLLKKRPQRILSRLIQGSELSELAELKLTKQLVNFIKLILVDGKFKDFKLILDQIFNLAFRQKFAGLVVVYSSRSLDSRELDNLTSLYREALSMPIIVFNELDPELIGGVRIKLGSKNLDFSLRNKLAALRKQLQ